MVVHLSYYLTAKKIVMFLSIIFQTEGCEPKTMKVNIEKLMPSVGEKSLMIYHSDDKDCLRLELRNIVYRELVRTNQDTTRIQIITTSITV